MVPRLCSELGARIFNCLVEMEAVGEGIRALGMGKTLGLGSRKKTLRKSTGTVKGFQKVSKAEPPGLFSTS